MEQTVDNTNVEVAIPQYSLEELRSEKPFEFLYSLKDNQFLMLQAQAELSEQAKKAGIKNFASLCKAYIKEQNKRSDVIMSSTTKFRGQPFALNTGKWTADEDGVYTYDRFGFKEYACPHPIMPIKRLTNIDTGNEKIEIAYKQGTKWRKLIADKRTIASNTSILDLSNKGVAVTSENSRALVSYLSDLESINYEALPERRSVTRLGWIGEYEFAPYSEDIEFDGEENFRSLYDTIHEHGDFNMWLDTVRRIRTGSIYARIVLAASFASVILKDCNLLPFFVHLWGGTETGKTVSLMLAASVWGNPEVGSYVQTFNSTTVAQEMLAGFLNNLPLIMDELQIIKDKNSFDELIYKLCEGMGKNRGQKSGGIQKVQTWRNCILTTGEYPLTQSNSGAGAVNRIIEVDCKEIQFFDNPKAVVNVLKENYGFAGKKWVEWLSVKENKQRVIDLQKKFYNDFEQKESTAKQAASASAIITADTLITEILFKDDCCLTVEDIAPLLVSKFRASQAERALNYIYDTVQINLNKFQENEFNEYKGEIWGCLDNGYIYIIKTKFDSIMADGGFSSKAFLSWAIENKVIKSKNGQPTITKRIKTVVSRVVAIKMPQDSTIGSPTPKPKAKSPEVENAPAVPTENDYTDPFGIFDDFGDEFDVYGE